MRYESVYLSGPIAGLTYREATGWRNEAIDLLRREHLVGTNPVIPIMAPEAVFPMLPGGYCTDNMSIMDFDLDSIHEACAVLVGYPTGYVPSVGTAVEVGYALSLAKPIILWLPDTVRTTLADAHPFILLSAAEMHNNLHAAVKAIVVRRPQDVAPIVSTAGGHKDDTGKLPMGLLPREPLEQVAAILAYGAKKYGAHNWRQGISVQRNIDAALRHIFKANEGEDLDPESNLPHFAHALCDLMFVVATLSDRPDLDDRYSPGGPLPW